MKPNTFVCMRFKNGSYAKAYGNLDIETYEDESQLTIRSNDGGIVMNFEGIESKTITKTENSGFNFAYLTNEEYKEETKVYFR